MIITTKKVKAVIGKSSTGFVITIEEFDWATAYGDSLPQARKNLENLANEYIQAYKEAGKDIPAELNNGNLEYEYVYDLSGFFKQFPFISATQLAKRLDINAGLMRQYKAGCASVGDMQKRKILEGLQSIGKELSEVQFK